MCTALLSCYHQSCKAFGIFLWTTCILRAVCACVLQGVGFCPPTTYTILQEYHAPDLKLIWLEGACWVYSSHQLEELAFSIADCTALLKKKKSIMGTMHVGYVVLYSIIFMSTTHVCVVYIGACLNVSQARDIINCRTWLSLINNHTFFAIQELGSQFWVRRLNQRVEALSW